MRTANTSPPTTLSTVTRRRRHDGWATRADLESLGLLPPKAVGGEGPRKGVCVGAYKSKPVWWKSRKDDVRQLLDNGPEHVLALAPGRMCGKSAGLVIPTMLAWDESVVVYDPKGEAWHLTSGHRSKGMGQRVFNFDALKADTSAVGAYNPLAEVRLDTSFAVNDAQSIATVLMLPTGAHTPDHWIKTGHSLMTAVILHCCHFARHELGRDACLFDVVEFLSRFRDDLDVLKRRFTFMGQYNHLGDKPHPAIEQEAQAMLERKPLEQSSIIHLVESQLEVFREPAVIANTSRSDWRVSDLVRGDRPTTVYLTVRPSDMARLRPLIRLILTQIAHGTTRPPSACAAPVRHKHRLLLMLDNFTELHRVAAIEEELRRMPDYGVKAFIVADTVEQLMRYYGRRECITADCRIRVCHPPLDTNIADALSGMTGRHIVPRDTSSAEQHLRLDTFKGSRDTFEFAGRTMVDIRIGIIRRADVLLLVAGAPPIRAVQELYYLDERLVALTKVRPPVNIHEAGDSGLRENDMADAETVLEQPCGAMPTRTSK